MSLVWGKHVGASLSEETADSLPNWCYLGIRDIKMHILILGGKTQNLKIYLRVSIVSLKKWMIWEGKEQKGSAFFFRNFYFFPQFAFTGNVGPCVKLHRSLKYLQQRSTLCRNCQGREWHGLERNPEPPVQIAGYVSTQPLPGKISKDGLYGISTSQTRMVI